MTLKPMPNIAVIGAGTMGAGIALTALQAGGNVYVQDTFPQMLDKAKDYVQKFLEKKDQADRLSNLHLTGKLSDLAAAQVVIEAAPENLDLKKQIFSQLDSICSLETIFASNTSTLSVTAIAAGTKHPERLAGMHFFNPAPVLPLVEIVRAAQTSEATVKTLTELALALGKTPVVTGDTPGFIVNRVARPFYGEALRLLGEGVADHETIDAIVEQSGGFRMGPLKLMDLIGIDINAAAMRSMYEQTFGEPRYRPHWIQMQKLASGDLGRKTGRGFYEYKEGDAKPETPQPAAGGGKGRVLISEGSWAPGLSELCRTAGYAVDSVADPDEKPAACFVVAGRAEEAPRLLAWYDDALPPDVPLLAQCSDTTVSEMATWIKHPQRLVGFDGLFFGNGNAVTLTTASELDGNLKSKVETLVKTLGRKTYWVSESPALVLPRIVCQLVNEAAFAQLEGVADGNTIDNAMKLGVNYPHGPLEWGKQLGYEKVLSVLDHLYSEYHEERYRACILLRRWARNAN